MNHLEQLVSEWYEYQGYYVRRNIRVAKRRAGGYEGELDVVAFHPERRHLVHVETSMDAMTWAKREERFKRKFEVGRKTIPGIFAGMTVPANIEQYVVFGYGGKGARTTLGKAKIVLIAELLGEILGHLREKSMHSEAVPEQFPLLRTLHFVAQHRRSLRSSLEATTRSNKSDQPTPRSARGG